jgi:hypothetical protein
MGATENVYIVTTALSAVMPMSLQTFATGVPLRLGAPAKLLVTDPAGEQTLGNGMHLWGILLPVRPGGWVADEVRPVVDDLHEWSTH